MIYFFIIVWMAVMAAASGGSLPRMPALGEFKFVPELLFSLPMAAAATYSLVNLPPLAAVASFFGFWSWSYLWMQTGHADALPWDDEKAYKETRQRDNTLTPAVNFIAGKVGVKRRTEAYAWIFQAVKGLLITLPVGGAGLLLWPFGYEIGSHARGRVKFDPHLIAEIASGAGAGISVCLFLYLVG